MARTRKCKYNASSKALAIFITSHSDVEDVITLVTALYIELQKINTQLTLPGRQLSDCFEENDYLKLQEALGDNKSAFEKMAQEPANFSLKLLAGSNVDYSKTVQEWWIQIAASRKQYNVNAYTQPIYFVSSNSHSLINLLSGFPYKEKEANYKSNQKIIEANLLEFNKEQVNEENICYYLSRFTEKNNNEYKQAKAEWEKKHGLIRLPAYHHIEIEAQLLPIRDFIKNYFIDKRINLTEQTKEELSKSNALILNIAYPLGMSAYNILKEVSENATDIRGVYIMGKAASLNASVGDITIPTFVFNNHTENQIFLDNILNVPSLAGFAPKNSIFLNQKAITLHGTFLQNEESLGNYYENGYSIVEMEAGPYLERIYEMQYPDRYPTKETFILNPAFRLGLAYYVSDTPYNEGINLGSKRLTWEGLNATYGISLGIINDILQTELNHIKNDIPSSYGQQQTSPVT